MIICVCKFVNETQFCEMAKECDSVKDLQTKFGVGTQCKKCLRCVKCTLKIMKSKEELESPIDS